MASSAVKAVTKSWPGGWNGSGMVIALDDKIVRGADYTQPKNAEDALAMATWVYRTLPGEVTGEGERADSYVVINPRNRDKVDARTLAHEFTHVATAPYGPYAPRWLVEGAATYVEFLPMDGAETLAIEKYRQDVRTKYLAKAKSLPADAVFFQQSDSSYPLSWLAVDYLFTPVRRDRGRHAVPGAGGARLDPGGSGPDHARTRRHDRGRTLPRAERARSLAA